MDPQKPKVNSQLPNNQGNGEVEDYQAASRAAAQDDYNEYSARGGTYTAPKHTLRKLILALLAVTLLVAVGFTVYKLVLHKDSKNTAKPDSSNSVQQHSNESSNAPIISKETEHHTSTNFIGLEFDYPKDWKVAETADGGVLTATSPVLVLKQADGQTSGGQVVFTIRNKQQALPEFDNGNAVAAIESEKINYTKPSSAQRAATYLSFLTYASSAATGAIDGIYITGDVGYQKDQAIPKADFTPVDPVIALKFVKCSDNTCSKDTTAMGIDAAMWKDTAFGLPLISMLQSLTIN